MSKYLLTGLETERLRFRKLERTDFETWLPFHQEPLSTEFWIGLPEDPVEACQHWFDKAFHRYDNDLGGMNVLIHKETNEFIGQCGLLIQTVDGIKELEVGYSMLPKYWRQGYATEAAQKCKAFAIENNLATSLISIINVDNIPSQKVAINNGMHLDKTTIFNENPSHIFRIQL
ncbi:GNAT family N-acetyltransferase [Maribacter algarum]|uniref:GNAT family N-acetyltransferase n=1 Tax=Maribacter algarum (ex Zhang et al. 2020) TaxID=2578118 RepID=A0A5S3PSH5_9FLAO|nr:GNAT family N-acetyltransferase [Maribacter algarum]TMM57956.1 GNAT family N-acetyltransferase [Maribacter algarum]